MLEVNRIKFQESIIRWHKKQGRHELSWRKTNDPFLILVAEILLRELALGKLKRSIKVSPQDLEPLESYPPVT